jgi:hypothetical protein
LADRLPGKGWFGWLGRQVGYVKKAVQTEPARLPNPSPGEGSGSAKPSSPQSDPAVIYREGRVEEADHPTQPGVKLRRTVIDEVIVKNGSAASSTGAAPTEGGS